MCSDEWFQALSMYRTREYMCASTAIQASWAAWAVDDLPANAGDVRYMGLIPELGRSPREGHGNPLQDSWLEDPMDRGAWRATVHGAVQSWTWLERLSRHARTPIRIQTEILTHIYIYIFIYLFLAMSCNLWFPSSPTRDRIRAMAIKMPSLNHWTTRKFPTSLFFSSIHIFDTHCYCWFQSNSTVFVLIFFFSISVSPFSNSKNENKKLALWSLLVSPPVWPKPQLSFVPSPAQASSDTLQDVLPWVPCSRSGVYPHLTWGSDTCLVLPPINSFRTKLFRKKKERNRGKGKRKKKRNVKYRLCLKEKGIHSHKNSSQT